VEAVTGTIHMDIMIAIPDTITGIMIVIINMGGKAAHPETDDDFGVDQGPGVKEAL
jgi:hypothetical protein